MNIRKAGQSEVIRGVAGINPPKATDLQYLITSHIGPQPIQDVSSVQVITNTGGPIVVQDNLYTAVSDIAVGKYVKVPNANLGKR